MSNSRTSVPDGPLDNQPGPLDLPSHEARRALTDILNTAGVPLGGWDRTLIDWLATHQDGSTVLTIASWIRGAAAGGAS